METNAPVFDAARPVAVQLRGPDGMKTVRTRFPTDDEWAERQRRRKVIVKQLGRQVSETTIPNGEDIDAALLAKTRTEETPEVDAFEAQKVTCTSRCKFSRRISVSPGTFVTAASDPSVAVLPEPLTSRVLLIRSRVARFCSGKRTRIV